MHINQIKQEWFHLKPNKLGTGLSLCVLLAVYPASAHDFWVQPRQFWLAVGGSTTVSLFVGHGPDRQLWDADIKRVTRLTTRGPKGIVDQIRSIQQGGTGRLSFADPGFHVVVLQTNFAASNLPAIRFNDYLAAEGLTPAIAYRKANNQTNLPGSEIYNRQAKSIVRVGTSNVRDARYITVPQGLTLEIVPEQNPYTLAANAPIPFRIYYEGQPLAGATVMLNNLGADAQPVAKQISDGAGRVAFRVPRRGHWQTNAIWTKPLPAGRAAQFETTFSSLTFGFDRAPAN